MLKLDRIGALPLYALWFTISLLLGTSNAVLSPAEWRKQSIYQLLTDRFAVTDGSSGKSDLTTYCGGSFKGIESHLDYIQGMGFTAIWISPIVKNIAGGYHGYWAQDLYSINENFGTAQDLKDLSAALHAKGMYLMVDIVVNHMGYRDGDLTNPDYSIYNPFNAASDYHMPACKIEDYNDQNQVEQCWLETGPQVSLPDLKTEDANVAQGFQTWVEKIVSDYGIDGFRVDTTRQVDKEFFPDFQKAAGGAHMLGEVFTGDPAYVCDYQNYISGLLNYPAYFWITQGFASASKSLSSMSSGITNLQKTCKDVSVLGNFIENHDNDRFPSMCGNDKSLIKNAIAFTILNDGIPIIYYGQEQALDGKMADGGDYSVREILWPKNYATDTPLYKWISALNGVRNAAIAKDATYTTSLAKPIFDGSSSSVLALSKGNSDNGGQVISVFTSAGTGGAPSVTLSSDQTGFAANAPLVEVMHCTSVNAGADGSLKVTLTGGETMVYVNKALLTGSGLCGDAGGIVTSSVSSSSSSSSSASSSSTGAASSSTVAPSLPTGSNVPPPITSSSGATSVPTSSAVTSTTTAGASPPNQYWGPGHRPPHQNRRLRHSHMRRGKFDGAFIATA